MRYPRAVDSPQQLALALPEAPEQSTADVEDDMDVEGDACLAALIGIERVPPRLRLVVHRDLVLVCGDQPYGPRRPGVLDCSWEARVPRDVGRRVRLADSTQ